MTKASENLFPGIIIRESANDGSDFSNPTADYRELFLGEDGNLHLKSSSGTVTDVGGSGGGGGFPLDEAEATGGLDATYGDDFTGASLDTGKWTRHVVGSGEESYQVDVGGSTIRYTYSTGAAVRYIYQTAPNGTNETWEVSFTPWQTASTGEMLSLIMVDSSGNGVGALLYDNTQAFYMAIIASHAYSSAGASRAYPVAWPSPGRRVWLRLRKASGVYHGSYSLNGHTYSPELSYTPSAFTPARIGFGRVLGTDANDIVDIHWFDKTA